MKKGRILYAFFPVNNALKENPFGYVNSIHPKYFPEQIIECTIFISITHLGKNFIFYLRFLEKKKIQI